MGGPTAGAGNIISGNEQGGVAIRGIDAVGDVVQGNLIGTDATGTRALGNGYSGVYIGDWGDAGDAASNATIEENVISANGNRGIWITGAGTTGVVVQQNLIGTDLTGTKALGKRVQRRRDRRRRGEQYDRRGNSRRWQRDLGQPELRHLITVTGPSGNLIQGEQDRHRRHRYDGPGKRVLRRR